MSDFHIKTEQFEGPLDLLLNLIEKRKLFINDISLAQVTDDFIEYIKQFDTSHSEVGNNNTYLASSAHFILIASTLLLIKSRSLLPSLTLTEEEQGSIDDLQNRLKELEKIKILSKHVERLFGTTYVFARLPRTQEPVFAPDDTQTIPRLYEALMKVLQNLPQKKEKLPEVIVRQIVSLEDMMEKLSARISSGLKMTFKEFSKEHQAEKVNVIVSFLAMLELVKNGLLRVEQHATFSDIHIETDNIGTPRYL